MNGESELHRGRSISIEQQLQGMHPDQLWQVLERQKQELINLGVNIPISDIVYGAHGYGHNYEDRRYSGGQAKATPLNCFMVLLHNDPSLKALPLEKFEELAGVIGRVAMIVEVLSNKVGAFDWPDSFNTIPNKSSTG